MNSLVRTSALRSIFLTKRYLARTSPGVSQRVSINHEGTIKIDNNQQSYKIDIPRLEAVVRNILEVLKLNTFSVNIEICTDAAIRELNEEYRKVSKATDILSFPRNNIPTPGKFPRNVHLAPYRHLGRMVIAPNYVNKVLKIDQQNFICAQKNGSSCQTAALDDRGVSKALSTEFDLQKRIEMLFVHGILHLYGYDHEQEDEWEVMTAREDEILHHLGYNSPNSSCSLLQSE